MVCRVCVSCRFVLLVYLVGVQCVCLVGLSCWSVFTLLVYLVGLSCWQERRRSEEGEEEAKERREDTILVGPGRAHILNTSQRWMCIRPRDPNLYGALPQHAPLWPASSETFRMMFRALSSFFGLLTNLDQRVSFGERNQVLGLGSLRAGGVAHLFMCPLYT